MSLMIEFQVLGQPVRETFLDAGGFLGSWTGSGLEVFEARCVRIICNCDTYRIIDNEKHCALALIQLKYEPNHIS